MNAPGDPGRDRPCSGISTGGHARTEVRDLNGADLADVVRIDALHTGHSEREYWDGVFARFVGRGRRAGRVGLAAHAAGGLRGYLFGEVRAFEFGSEECGWVFAIGVESGHLRAGVASRLLDAAVRRFHDAGITRVRTMVRRNDVPVLSFFRSAGFVGGSFVQLEIGIDQVAAPSAAPASEEEIA